MTKKVSPETLTDEMVLELGNDPRSSLVIKAWCIAAMRIVYHHSKKGLTARAEARKKVCDAINARAERDGTGR